MIIKMPNTMTLSIGHAKNRFFVTLSKNHRTLRYRWRGVEAQERQETLLVRWPNGSVCHAYTHQRLGSLLGASPCNVLNVNNSVIFQNFFTPNHISKKCKANWPKKIKPKTMAAIHAPLPLRSSHVSERSNQDGLEYSAV